jgi:hypothetical protein
MESDPPSEQYGRGMRQGRKSLRGKQAAGLDDEAIKQLSRPSNGTTDPSILSRPSSTSTPQYRKLPPSNMDPSKAPARGKSPTSTTNRHGDTQSSGAATLPERNVSSKLQPASNSPALVKDSAATSNIKQPAMHPPVPESKKGITPGRAIDSAQPTPTKPAAKVSKPQKASQKKAAKQTRPAPQQQPRKAQKVKEDIQKFVTDDPQFSATRFHIYQWERPIPTDFLNLPDDWKAAKARVDAEEGEKDDAPELDDWHEFCGTDNMLLPIPLKIGIRLNFIGRAKRAFRAGRSFASFEQEELVIDSKAGANAIRDPVERALALRSALDNDTRLYVYEQLKVRLCHEIWLEPYPEVDESALSRAKLSFNEAGASSQQPRTKPQLPRQFRELHQPQGRKPRMS